ncbi:MAG TPA: serine/threonine-protein kinase [Gemmatimonadales bacterium]|nr:serine/threonine-protein kinase [Gemmatimonadales bacterium]
MSDALVGDTLERLRLTLAEHYAVTRELGRGGMAVVYLADDIRHDRQVAIKVLMPELAASLGGDRFLREIRVAAKLQHPHILPLFDSGSRDGLLYYVMPFVEGESLRDKLNREKQLDIGEAIRLAGQVADALHYAHKNGVVHRDIKPENIMLSGGHALVADFGIAKAVSAAGGERLTQTGMAIGTPYYMSPEQAIGEGLDGRSDQYSLACVLYELLAGQPPFTGPTPMAVLARHSLERVPSLQIVRHSIPEGVELVILRALEKVPADRYGNMGEFADALRSAEIERISTRTGARAVPTRDLPRSPVAPGGSRTKRLLALAGVALAVLLAGAGLYLSRRGAPETEPGAIADGPDPRRIAVLYFQSRGGSDSLVYLADGLTEALINELSRVKGLQVISRNGVALYRDAPVSPDSIARALKVGTLVSGTLAQLGDRLRVNVALINPTTGAELSSKTVEQPRAAVFALQEDLAKEVSVFLRQELGQEVQLQESRIGTRNEKAWELLQRARAEAKSADHFIAQDDSAAARRQFARADSLFGQAESADPKWVTPVAQRAWLAYRQSRFAESDRTNSSEWIQRGMQHAERALAMKGDDPDALEIRGTLRYWRFLNNLEPDPAASAKLLLDAEADFRAAVAANPTQASAWTSLSHLLLGWKREPAEGKLAAMRAYEADPYLTNANVTLWRLTSSSVDLEDAVEAKRWCDEGRRRFPDDPRFAECQLLVFSLKGQRPDVAVAWKMAEEYVRLSPPNVKEYRQHEGQMLVAMALARAGLPDSARAVALRARADAALDPTRELALWETYVRTMLGDKDEAFRLLSTYLAANPQDRPSNTDPGWWLRDLTSDPRWKSIAGPSR